MRRTFNEEVANYRRYLSKHELIEQPWSTTDVRAFRLRPPGYEGRCETVDIVFLERLGQIVVAGDLCPGRHGVASANGYGLGWFSKPLSPDYLAEKFLARGWHEELVRDGLDDLEADLDREAAEAAAEAEDDEVREGDEGRRGAHREAIREARRCLEDGDPRGVYDALVDAGYDAEDVPGHGYRPRDMALLAVINERFAALFVDNTAQPAEAPAPASPTEPPSRFEQALAETEAHLARERARLEEG